MIFIDSWIWLEYFQEDEHWKEAETVIRQIQKEHAVIAATVLTEVRYHIKRRVGEDPADRMTAAIDSFDNLEIAPITGDVAVYAVDLRDKYYQRGDCELSYADAIHLAVAVMTNCDTLYTGDPDFAAVDEIDTTIV